MQIENNEPKRTSKSLKRSTSHYKSREVVQKREPTWHVSIQERDLRDRVIRVRHSSSCAPKRVERECEPSITSISNVERREPEQRSPNK